MSLKEHKEDSPSESVHPKTFQNSCFFLQDSTYNLTTNHLLQNAGSFTKEKNNPSLLPILMDVQDTTWDFFQTITIQITILQIQVSHEKTLLLSIVLVVS